MQDQGKIKKTDADIGAVAGSLLNSLLDQDRSGSTADEVAGLLAVSWVSASNQCSQQAEGVPVTWKSPE
jgi:hypothetical protein